MESPCINDCFLDDDVCTGCGRTREEIINWCSMSEEERQEVINRVQS